MPLPFSYCFMAHHFLQLTTASFYLWSIHPTTIESYCIVYALASRRFYFPSYLRCKFHPPPLYLRLEAWILVVSFSPSEIIFSQVSEVKRAHISIT